MPARREAIVTLADKWFAEGKAEGRAEGKVEGRAEGRAEVLCKLLTLKFGDLPAHVSHRLRTASESEMDAYAERILGAVTLDQMLL
jgi:flagellar biosynthesis/type III secretory pathway protein FliH